MEHREISRAVIKRLPRYYRYLGELMQEGVERISSGELSKRMQITASQIRQDLNNFGGFGQQGYGYNVKYLYHEIGKILGLDRTYNLIIIGAGNLGQAIANYANFERRGFCTDMMCCAAQSAARSIKIRLSIPNSLIDHVSACFICFPVNSCFMINPPDC